MHVDPKNPHLGGYIEGGDADTTYPDLWGWMHEQFQIESLIDVGCGDGVALRYFRSLGIDAVGVDGIPQDDPDIRQHDFTKGSLTWHYHEPGLLYDVAWCCEFVEHVEEKYMRNYLTTFRCASYVFMTHAFPGQAGHHHVNCQLPIYWKGAMAAAGFEFMEAASEEAREKAALNGSAWNHFARSGMIFERLP